MISNLNHTLSFIVPDSIHPWVYIAPFRQWQHAQKIKALIAKVPSDANISATNYMIPHVSSCWDIIRFPALELIDDATEKVTVNYIMVDLWQMQQDRLVSDGDRRRLKEMTLGIERLLSQNLYGLLDYRDGIVLLQRGVTSDAAALSVWKAYRQEIDPILEIPDKA